MVWFGLIKAGTILLALSSAEHVPRRLDLSHPAAPARTLAVIYLLLIAGAITFAPAPSFGVALAGYWVAVLMRSLAGLLVTAWLNRTAASIHACATVLSTQGQAATFGQLAGGPAIGFIATTASLRAAMIAAAVMLGPALLLFGRSLRRRRSTLVVRQPEAARRWRGWT